MTDDQRFTNIDRRKFIKTTGLVGGAGLVAGCTDGGGDGTTATDDGGTTATDDDGGDDDGMDDDGEETTTQQEPLGGTFIDTSSQAANTFDPRTNELAWVSSMISYLFDGLLIQQPDGSGMVPHVAKELPTEEEELTFTVPLEEGVQFHNGDELTAEDVAYTYNWILDPENGSVRRQNVAFMDSVEAVEDYTVRFNLNEPNALFRQSLGEAIVPKSVAEGMDSQDFGSEPIGSGPFQFVEWEQSDHVTLERFDDYFLQTPNLDEYTVRVIPEKQVQFVELSTGAVTQASIPANLLDRAKDEDGLTITNVAQFDYNGLIFNSLREPFDDVRVREAMQYLVDYDEMVQSSKGELGKRTYGFMPKSVNEAWEFPWQEWDDQYYPERDHDRAQELLAEAGYGDGLDKTLDIHTLSFDKFSSMAIILQNELEQVGIEAEITELTIGEWVDELNTDSYDVNVYGWSGGQDPDGYYYFLLRDLNNDEGGPPEENFAGNSSAGMLHEANPDDEELERVDEIAREARRLQDRSERTSLYVEAAELMQSKYPHIPVFTEQTAVAYENSVKDYELTSYAQQPLCNEWNNAYIEE